MRLLQTSNTISTQGPEIVSKGRFNGKKIAYIAATNPPKYSFIVFSD